MIKKNISEKLAKKISKDLGKAVMNTPLKTTRRRIPTTRRRILKPPRGFNKPPIRFKMSDYEIRTPLKKIGIENFKIYQNKTEIDLTALNPIYGENGSGKSTIAELFQLLKTSKDRDHKEGENILSTYEKKYKSWSSPSKIFSKHKDNKSLLIQFETTNLSKFKVTKELMPRGLIMNDFEKKIRFPGVKIMDLIFNCLRKEEEGSLDVLKILDSKNFNIKDLLEKLSFKSGEEDLLEMSYKVQMYFDVIKKDDQSESSSFPMDIIALSSLKISDLKTNMKLLEFKTRREIKKIKKYANPERYAQASRFILEFSNLLYGINTNNTDPEKLIKLETDDDLVLTYLCNSGKSKKFWKILSKLRKIIDGLDESERKRDGLSEKLDLEEFLNKIDSEALMRFSINSLWTTCYDFLGTDFEINQRSTLSKSPIFSQSRAFGRTRGSYWNDREFNPLNVLLRGIESKIHPRFYAGAFEGPFFKFLDDIMYSFNSFIINARFIEPIRLELEDLYRIRNRAPTRTEIIQQEVWHLDAITTMIYHDRSFIKKLNKWLPLLGLNYKLSMSEVHNVGGKAMVSLYATDKLSGANKIDLQDLGFGVANAIRIIVALLRSKNRNIFLSEPEQNLHPSVHINFVELAVESIKENKNRLFIETHSENLCLKILNVVKNKKLDPGLVIINVTERNKRGSKVNQIKVSSDGRFLSPWPKPGFFSDRYGID